MQPFPSHSMQDELAKERHDQELRELQAAISASKQPNGTGTSVGDPDQSDTAMPAAPFKLEGMGRSRDLKPYVADATSFLPEADASRQLSSLKQENDILKRCLDDRSNPAAFQQYLAKATL